MGCLRFLTEHSVKGRLFLHARTHTHTHTHTHEHTARTPSCSSTNSWNFGIITKARGKALPPLSRLIFSPFPLLSFSFEPYVHSSFRLQLTRLCVMGLLLTGSSQIPPVFEKKLHKIRHVTEEWCSWGRLNGLLLAEIRLLCRNCNKYYEVVKNSVYIWKKSLEYRHKQTKELRGGFWWIEPGLLKFLPCKFRISPMPRLDLLCVPLWKTWMEWLNAFYYWVKRNQLDATYFIIYSILIQCSTCFGR